MSALAFLLLAVAISVLGSLLLLVRVRKPTSAEYSIEAFRREMDALSPEQDPRRKRR
jgi:hypothetical protein